MAIILANGNGVGLGANDGFDYVSNGDIYQGVQPREVMISSSSDLVLLGDYPAGSIAYTAGYGSMWQKKADNTWVQFVGEGGAGNV